MVFSKKLQTILLLLGDISLFYLSLYITLILRFGPFLRKEYWHLHQMPFLFIHLVWIIIFYIAGLYEIHVFGSFKKILERLVKAVPAAIGFAILVFYLMPEAFLITPKTNLLIDISILAMLVIGWRRLFWYLVGKVSKIKTLFFGTSEEVEKMAGRLRTNPRLGYEPTIVLDSVDHNLIDLIKQHNIQLIVASKNIMQDEKAAKRFYEALPLGVSIINFENFYESLVEKIPVSIINETWFLENLMEIDKKIFEKFKRIIDIVFAILLGIPTLLVFPLVATAIKVESRGPVFLKQKRTGKNENIFHLFKFRSMYALSPDGSAETEITGWEKPSGKDKRLTRFGNILRKTRIDELPQIWNILKGEMSFIGPRPERPEFIEQLKKEVPHYTMRHLVKPGVSGWSQVKFTSASAIDAMEKLQYDLYYVKNRSLVLDLVIAAKTLATILSHQGR